VKHCLETAELVAPGGEVAQAGRRAPTSAPAAPASHRAPAASVTADTLRPPPVALASRTVVTAADAGGR
jgi:hypothetical protein